MSAFFQSEEVFLFMRRIIFLGYLWSLRVDSSIDVLY